MNYNIINILTFFDYNKYKHKLYKGDYMKKIRIYGIILLLLLTVCSGIMQNKCFAYAEENFDLTAKSAILMDYNSGTIIYEKDKDKKLPIASMVKMMTIYITFQKLESGYIKYEQEFTSSENVSKMGGSQVFMDPYVNYTVKDLLKSVIMASANDASVALAEGISGSEGEFVKLMNDTAKTLGMNNTYYVNSTGLPAPEQYSCAYDCAILLKNILKYDDYHKFSTIWMDSLTHPSGRKTELVNTNKLIRYYNGCDSGKTGSTGEAGYCLTSSAVRNNMRLISVVIGAKTGKDRFKESTSILNYGFANFENKQLVNKVNVLKELSTKKCKNDIAEIIPVEDFFAFDKKGSSSNYNVTVELPESIGATKVGEIVGRVIISKEGNVIKIIGLTVKNDVEGLSFIDNVKNIIANMY